MITAFHFAIWTFVSCLITGVVVLGLLAFSTLLIEDKTPRPRPYDDMDDGC
jgi:hypothetical protein